MNQDSIQAYALLVGMEHRWLQANDQLLTLNPRIMDIPDEHWSDWMECTNPCFVGHGWVIQHRLKK